MKTESVIDELRAALAYNARTTLSSPRYFELDPDWYTQFLEESRGAPIEDIGMGEYEHGPLGMGTRRSVITFCDIPVVPHSGPLETGFRVVM